jgi:hypothetical protein
MAPSCFWLEVIGHPCFRLIIEVNTGLNFHVFSKNNAPSNYIMWGVFHRVYTNLVTVPTPNVVYLLFWLAFRLFVIQFRTQILYVETGKRLAFSNGTRYRISAEALANLKYLTPFHVTHEVSRFESSDILYGVLEYH